MQRKKATQGSSLICKLLPSMVFLLFIGLVMINTTTEDILGNWDTTPLSIDSLFAFADGFEEVLQDHIYRKNDFIELNGLTARLLGQNSLNQRQKLANGALTHFSSPPSTDIIAQSAYNTGELAQFLEERGIGFLYVLAPSKRTIYDAAFAPGYEEDCGQEMEMMAQALTEAGVDIIDMNTWFQQNGWTSEDALFRTDHHWKPEAAFQAARLTMEYLERQGLSGYNKEWFSADQWTIEVWEDHFLGSDGKRTGILYAGLDDISIYKPNFPTDYTYSRCSNQGSTWTYLNGILDESYRDRQDFYTDNPYYAYMYNDSPIRITQNRCGWNRQRVLLMGNSYKMPYEYFLTTQFQEVYTIDLRYYTDGTAIQAIQEIQPDIVLMCTHTLASAELHEFGMEAYRTALEETRQNGVEPMAQKDVSLEAQADNNDHFTVIFRGLEAGRTYTLTVDNTAIQGGQDHFLQMSLRNLSANKPVANHYFAADSQETQKWIFTVPDGTEDPYAVYLYAGTRGHTANVSIQAQGITLYSGILEDSP